MSEIISPEQFIAGHYIGSAIEAGQIAQQDYLRAPLRRQLISLAGRDLTQPNGKIVTRLVGIGGVHLNMGKKVNFVIPGSPVGFGIYDGFSGDLNGKTGLTYDIYRNHPWSNMLVRLAVNFPQVYRTLERGIRFTEYPVISPTLAAIGELLAQNDFVGRLEFLSYAQYFKEPVRI